MPALEETVLKKNKTLKGKNLFRSIKISERYDGVNIIRDEKHLISFCCNDYFGLAQDKRLIGASVKATEKYGTGSASSRLITGNHPLYEELETLLARKKGTEAACVFGSGYLANIGTISALVKKGDLIIVDKLSHSCIHSGAKLSGAAYKIYSHNSLDNLNNILKNNRKKYNNCLVITETVFSMDGDVSPVRDLYKIVKKYDSWLMTDDAHGFGIIENCEADIQMGTLSKAAGSYGGYVCASRAVIDYIKTSARSLIYSTALPPSVMAASIAAIKIIASDKKLCESPLRKARLFTDIIGTKRAESAIVPLISGDEKKAVKASKELEKQGFLVAAIRPPTVPKGTSRLRFTFSALHKDKDIKRIGEFIKNTGWAV